MWVGDSWDWEKGVFFCGFVLGFVFLGVYWVEEYDSVGIGGVVGEKRVRWIGGIYGVVVVLG